MVPPGQRFVEFIFKDFKARRKGVIKALTRDFKEFYQRCDPTRENLYLYGNSDEKWEVLAPTDRLPPKTPEPTLGINNSRNGMLQKDWASYIAVLSDSWLLSLAFFNGAKIGFSKEDRQSLFEMINELPTVLEVVTGPETMTVNALRDQEGENDPNNTCGKCGDSADLNGFWICCDACDSWFHGSCVDVTPEMADKIERYTCPKCRRGKRAKV